MSIALDSLSHFVLEAFKTHEFQVGLCVFGGVEIDALFCCNSVPNLLIVFALLIPLKEGGDVCSIVCRFVGLTVFCCDFRWEADCGCE